MILPKKALLKTMIIGVIIIFISTNVCFGQTKSQALNEVNVAEDVLATYIGTYELDPSTIIYISKVGNQMRVQLTGQPANDIFAKSNEEFYVEDFPVQFIFNKDKNNRTESLRLIQSGYDMTAEKLLNTADFFSFSPVSDDPAVKLLSSLSQEQRIIVCYPLDHISKSQWHFLPGSMEPRAGIQLSALNDQQKKMVYNLLQSSLSETGYTKTLKIIDLENVLLEMSGNSKMRDPEKYSVAFYGNPQKDSLWAWSFEGHHLSLNFTVFNGVTSIAPQFLGASPATILSGDRKGQRTLEREEDLGLELINSLSKAQQRIAIFQEKPIYNIFTGNSREVGPLTPVGISYGALNRTQQSTFLKLINEYISSMPVEVAERRMEKIRNEELDEVMFGWAGAISAREGHYYRIQGSSFLIEFDNSTDHANHIHTVWRDFAGDFGRNLIREHHNKSHHH